MKYNIPGSDIYKLAEAMENQSKRLIMELSKKLNLPLNTMDKQEVNLGVTSNEREDVVKQKGRDSQPYADEDEDDDFGFDREKLFSFDAKIEFVELLKRVNKKGMT